MSDHGGSLRKPMAYEIRGSQILQMRGAANRERRAVRRDPVVPSQGLRGSATLYRPQGRPRYVGQVGIAGMARGRGAEARRKVSRRDGLEGGHRLMGLRVSEIAAVLLMALAFWFIFTVYTL